MARNRRPEDSGPAHNCPVSTEFAGKTDKLLARFTRLFVQLDRSATNEDPQVTIACIAALFDRMLNPPESDQDVPPTDSDIDRTSHALHELIEREAERVRQIIQND